MVSGHYVRSAASRRLILSFSVQAGIVPPPSFCSIVVELRLLRLMRLKQHLQLLTRFITLHHSIMPLVDY